jgi:putative alpha-1,2-mannosidase
MIGEGLGYLTIEGTDRPISKRMEYAANDYAIALIAQGWVRLRIS